MPAQSFTILHVRQPVVYFDFVLFLILMHDWLDDKYNLTQFAKSLSTH